MTRKERMSGRRKDRVFCVGEGSGSGEGWMDGVGVREGRVCYACGVWRKRKGIRM